jgi:Nif-specific regulatory protein
MSNRDLDELQRERDEYAKAVATLSSRFDEKVEELSFIRMVGDALARCTTVETICEAIVQLIQETIAPENCSVFLLDDDEIILRSAMGAFDEAAGYYEAALSPCVFVRGNGLIGAAVEQRRMLRLADATEDARFEKRPKSRVVPRSILVVPLIFDERVIGVVNLSDSEPSVFEARHERLLAITANFAALAFETAVLFEEVSDSRAQLQKENAVLKEQLTGHVSVKGLVGDDPKFQVVVQLMHKVADTSANVLVTGESGTGKEVFARALHSESSRRNKPFIAINCGALPESLLEAELFGIERGVATGVDARAGTFEQASGGTLFLDEIGDMALSVQVRLLRVLQERQVVRVGGSKVIEVDVRVIAATHRNLAQRIIEGSFRQDLYYRLKVVTLDLPSLRERPKDILTLTRFFVHRFADRHERPVPILSTAAARALVTYDWPGNIRELEHNVEQAIILADGDVLYPENFGLAKAERSGLTLELPDHIESLSAIRQEAEALLDRELIARALSLADNNRTKAAELLKISRRALHYKLRKLSLIE